MTGYHDRLGTQKETKMYETCPKCGGTAVLVQSRDDVEEIPDLDRPSASVHVPVKVEEYRCEDPGCEHEFERIVREPSS
jgi:transposase